MLLKIKKINHELLHFETVHSNAQHDQDLLDMAFSDRFIFRWLSARIRRNFERFGGHLIITSHHSAQHEVKKRAQL